MGEAKILLFAELKFTLSFITRVFIPFLP